MVLVYAYAHSTTCPSVLAARRIYRESRSYRSRVDGGWGLKMWVTSKPCASGVDLRRAGDVNPLVFVANPSQSGDVSALIFASSGTNQGINIPRSPLEFLRSTPLETCPTENQTLADTECATRMRSGFPDLGCTDERASEWHQCLTTPIAHALAGVAAEGCGRSPRQAE